MQQRLQQLGAEVDPLDDLTIQRLNARLEELTGNVASSRERAPPRVSKKAWNVYFVLRYESTSTMRESRILQNKC